MYTRSSFGSYYPINSIIHRLNPLIKIINFLIAVLLIIITNSVVVTYSLLLFIVIMMLLSKVPFKYYFDTFWHLRYIYLLIGVICYIFSVNALNTSVYIAKLVIIVEYLNIISYTTSPSENIWGIERLLSVFNYLYLPVSLLAAKINGLFRYLPLYNDTKNQVLKSSYSRGVTSNRRMFFVTRRLTKKNMNDIKEASELRLYNVKLDRTNYRTNSISFNDVLFLVFHILLVIVFIVEKGLL